MANSPYGQDHHESLAITIFVFLVYACLIQEPSPSLKGIKKFHVPTSREPYISSRNGAQKRCKRSYRTHRAGIIIEAPAISYGLAPGGVSGYDAGVDERSRGSDNILLTPRLQAWHSGGWAQNPHFGTFNSLSQVAVDTPMSSFLPFGTAKGGTTIPPNTHTVTHPYGPIAERQSRAPSTTGHPFSVVSPLVSATSLARHHPEPGLPVRTYGFTGVIDVRHSIRVYLMSDIVFWGALDVRV